MIMNRISKYILTGFASLSLTFVTTGCNDLFKDAPVDKLAEPSIWKSPNLLDEYSLVWYNNLTNGFSTMMSTSWFLRYLSKPYTGWFTDQITYSRTEWSRTIFAEEVAGEEEAINTAGSNEWGKCYEMIQHINRLLANANEIADGPHKNRILGEAHFFRGWYYYQLLRRFGAPMLIENLYDPLNDHRKFPRSSYEEMVNYIASEADKAASLLAVKNDPENVGRVTKGAAIMLKAKAYFWVGSPAFQNKGKAIYGFTSDRSKEMMQKAVKAYEELINLGCYSLVPVTGNTESEIAESYNALFRLHNSPESIYEVQHSPDGIVDNFGHHLDEDAASPFFAGTSCAYVPTQNHVDEYGMRDGKTYDAQHPYANRDYRFYANITYDGSTYNKHEFEIHYTVENGKEVPGVDLTKYGTNRNVAVTRTGYYMRKFLDPKTELFGDRKYGSKQHYIIWRYAEALLDYAEAQFRVGNAAKALEAVNEVRKRVHMDALPSVTLEQILHERRVELAFEESIYWDYLRLGTAFDKLNGSTNPLRGVKIVKTADGATTYTVSDLKSQAAERVFRANQYYYPIPWSEVRYHGIEQNEGWHEME